MVQGRLLTAHPGSVHGGGEAPEGRSSLWQGAGKGPDGAPDLGSAVIRPKCITILYHNSSLFIDIFHITMMFLCCFGLFYTVCNFPVPKQQMQDSAVKRGR